MSPLEAGQSGGQPPVLVLCHLTKQYGTLTAVDDLSLVLDRGHILGLIGPNGAGKTTTIRILVGQARPTRGSATVAGADCVRDARQIKRLVGYMPDVFGYYDNMRVQEYLDFFGAAFRMPRRQRAERIDAVMETAGCTGFRDQFLETLSFGMKQRVGIARTLLHDPEILILDEPGTGLDPKARIEMRELLLRLAAMGKTLIVTSHILPELSRICDRVAILVRGRLRAFGTLDEILRTLSERSLVEVQLLSADRIDAAAAVIRRHVGDDAQIAASPAEAIVRFRASQSDQDRADLLAALVAEGLSPSQFREVPMDLEDTFLSVMRREEASAAPAPSSARGSGGAP